LSRKGLFMSTSHNGANRPRITVTRVKDESLYLAIAFRGVNTLEIISHAQDRMTEREITQEDVIRTLANPDDERDSTQMPGRREAFWNKTAKFRIKVVFEQLNDRIRVFSTSKSIRRLSGR
jgi:hypothetical protein